MGIAGEVEDQIPIGGWGVKAGCGPGRYGTWPGQFTGARDGSELGPGLGGSGIA